MSADTDPRKSPCCLAAHTGADSRENPHHTLSNNPPMSIQRSQFGARILLGWVDEARRIHKEARDTKREIHAIAVERQLAGISEQIGRFC
jgi:hypothetical protein